MKRYHIKIIGGASEWIEIVEAKRFEYSSSGNYVFFIENDIVACYPIHRTIIYRIDDI